MKYVIGVDVGGTFTDAIAAAQDGAVIWRQGSLYAGRLRGRRDERD